MESIFNDVRGLLEGWGVWTILILLLVKTALGIIVAIQKGEFKWFYLGNVLKEDGLKVAALFIIQLMVAAVPDTKVVGEVAITSFGALLTADFIGGIVKNIAHLSPQVAENVPSSLREPARLRLGNPRNLTNQ